MFFQVGFVLLIPLVFTIARQTGVSLVKIGVPLVAGLSVVHGLVPPHPAAMAAVGIFNADVGLTILYALIVGLPTAILAGPVYGQWIVEYGMMQAIAEGFELLEKSSFDFDYEKVARVWNNYSCHRIVSLDEIPLLRGGYVLR